jgi:Kef-type K+ transport system membrane component KefB
VIHVLAAASESLSFEDVLVMSAAAFAVRLFLGFVPRIRVPGPVLEIVIGVIIGPQVLGLAVVDEPVAVLSTLGLAFLLFLAGMEVDVQSLKGRDGRIAFTGFGISIVIALAIGFTLEASGLIINGLLVGFALTASSLGVLIPLLADEGELRSPLGRFVIAGASVGEIGVIVLLALFFSGSGGPGSTLVVLGAFAVFAVIAVVALSWASGMAALERVLARLQDTSAQIRVRFAIVLLIASITVASGLGLEAILGAFAAGAIVSLVDRNAAETHPLFHVKLEAIGYGFLVPLFFVTSGANLDIQALFEDPETIVKVVIFTVSMLVVRGLPVLLGRGTLDPIRLTVAGLLESGSLPILVTAATIGTATGQMTSSTAAALVIAGLVATIIYPTLALALLKRVDPDAIPDPTILGEVNPEEM